MTNRELAEEIKSRVSTKNFCAGVGIWIDRHGSALCPFHGDRKTPSLKVYEDPSRGWHCFGCGKGGSVIDFAMEWYGIGFRQAILRIDFDFNLGLPISKKQTAEDRRKSRKDAQKRALNAKLKEQRRRDIEGHYWACFDRLLAIVRDVEAHRPKNINDEFSEEWAKAIRILPEAKEEYEEAQDTFLIISGGR